MSREDVVIENGRDHNARPSSSSSSSTPTSEDAKAHLAHNTVDGKTPASATDDDAADLADDSPTPTQTNKMGTTLNGMVNGSSPEAAAAAATEPRLFIDEHGREITEDEKEKLKRKELPEQSWRFAPLSVPRQRRLQTLAVMFWGILLPASISFFFLLV